MSVIRRECVIFFIFVITMRFNKTPLLLYILYSRKQKGDWRYVL